MMDTITLNTPLEEIGAVQKRFLPKLVRLKIKTVKDLLWHFPTRYEDWREVSPIADLKPGDEKTIQGIIQEVKQTRSWQKKMIITDVLIQDDSGSIRAVWFNQPYIGQMLTEGKLVNIAGKISMPKTKKAPYFSNPAYEIISKNTSEPKHTARIVSIYPETRGLTSKGIRFMMKNVLDSLEDIPEFIPQNILDELELSEINDAMQKIHLPEDAKEAEPARERFAFEDLFLLQLKNIQEKSLLKKQQAYAISYTHEELKEIRGKLPFTLTASQEKSLMEILEDISKPNPMNRLLQGDVGSGKTIVAGIAALITASPSNGLQTAFMAPTEILARQHYKTLTTLFHDFTGGIGLLLAREARIFYGDELEEKTTKADLIKKVAAGKIKIVIGTHTLIQKSIEFENLGLVVIDEQHRFGVRQRATLLHSDPKNPNTSELPEENETKKDKIVEKELSYKLTGVLFEVQKEIGRFGRERQYADLLAKKLEEYKISFKREYAIEVAGIKSNFADFFIEDKIILELKAKPYIEKSDYYQVLRYLEAADRELGMIINFRNKHLKPKRVLNPKFGSFGLDSGHSDRLSPHFVSMSATPIPRTLMMTVFGNLDMSLITELPKGRREIITKIVDPDNRDKAYAFIRGQVQKGRQVYVVCPRIEASNSESEVRTAWDDVKAVEEEYEKLSKKTFPDLRVAMLHGKLKSAEKADTMKAYSGGETDILVSTSVIEVGIDVPNATIMMIESAERFGLAQLYQFRGRVGRGEHQSFCFLFTESHTANSHKRLTSLINAKNSFELAEKDLEIRGPGEFLGDSQSGLPDIAMTAIQNPKLLKSAQEKAQSIFHKDPELKNHPELKKRLDEFGEKIHLE